MDNLHEILAEIREHFMNCRESTYENSPAYMRFTRYIDAVTEAEKGLEILQKTRDGEIKKYVCK